MSAQVDAARGEVSAGDQRWRFELDCRHGTVAVDLGVGRRVRLRPHSWRAKRVLARFAHLGERLVKDQLLRLSLDDTASVPEDPAQHEALVALALWVNAPGGEPPLPLDQRVLAAVTVQVCRAMQAPPDSLDGLDAADVELLWRAARGDAAREPNNEVEATRILVVPDPSRTEGGAAATPGPASAHAALESQLQPTTTQDRAPRARPAPTDTVVGWSATAPVDMTGPRQLAQADTAVGRSATAPVEMTGPHHLTPVAVAPVARGGADRPTSVSTVESERRDGRFRMSLDVARPTTPPPRVPAEGPAPVMAAQASSVPPARPAEAPSRVWPWPVTGAVALGSGAALAPPDTDARAATARLGLPPQSPGEVSRDAAPVPLPPMGSVLAIAEPLFDELAVRLEQAAGELGIDLEG